MIVLKIINICLALTFVRFTYWQHNDPDNFLWLFTYGFACGVCVAGAFGKLKPVVSIIAAAVFLPWSAYLYIRLKEHGLDVEEWREALGLLVCSAAMINLLLINRFSKKKEEPSDEMRQPAPAA